MVKQILPATVVILFLSSCTTTLKTLNFTNQKVETLAPPSNQQKFIEEITVTPRPNAVDKTHVRPDSKTSITLKNPSSDIQVQESNQLAMILSSRNAAVEVATPLQLKYAVLLNTEVESLPNPYLLEGVDQWYGVRYRTGGISKKGVDCSGFSVAVYAAVYGVMLPRVSREQYRISRKISTTELQEGDLLFFDTRGGGNVSHVGIYLGNNKFIHASVSKGVMINDLFQSYYLQRFIGAGRIDNKPLAGAAAPDLLEGSH